MTRIARVSMVVLAVLIAAAVLVPLLAGQDPLAIGDVLRTRLSPPFARDGTGRFHLLGTDAFGRDLFVRMMLAGRISLVVGIVGSLLASAAGIGIGALAAWRGGWLDRIAMAAADTVLAVPRLVLLLVCVALWEPGVTTVILVLVATGWMSIARLTRAEVLGVMRRPYVEAARASGLPGGRLLWRHILPNALGPAIVATTLGVGSAILLESGLSFLGLGIQPPAPSWGNMIAGGREVLVVAPWVALAPGLALIATVTACTLLGDALRDRLAGETVTGLAERA